MSGQNDFCCRVSGRRRPFSVGEGNQPRRTIGSEWFGTSSAVSGATIGGTLRALRLPARFKSRATSLLKPSTAAAVSRRCFSPSSRQIALNCCLSLQHFPPLELSADVAWPEHVPITTPAHCLLNWHRGKRMRRLSWSFCRRILISSTIVFPIVGLPPLILWTGNYVRVKGQRFDPDQELSLMLLDCLDVQEGGQQVHARASKCFYSRLLNRCCCATTIKQLLYLIMFWQTPPLPIYDLNRWILLVVYN